MTGAKEFLVFNCKVIEKDGDFAYFGNVPGLIITILENKELEVGDEALFVFDKDSHYWNYKLEEGERYLGNRTPEKLEMISEDGKFQYIVIKHGKKALYPSDTLYPSDKLYPKDTVQHRMTQASFIQGSLRYEDYLSKKISIQSID